jgi:hypothetical protein
MINRFTNFLNNIAESLDTPEKVEYIEQNNDKWLCNFFINNIEYRIEILSLDPALTLCYGVKFYIYDNGNKIYQKTENNNDKNSKMVFATVKFVCNNFITDVSPNCLFFYCSDDNQARKFIYMNYCDLVTINNKEYSYIENDRFKRPLFLLYKTTFNVMDVVKWLITTKNTFII